MCVCMCMCMCVRVCMYVCVCASVDLYVYIYDLPSIGFTSIKFTTTGSFYLVFKYLQLSIF